MISVQQETVVHAKSLSTIREHAGLGKSCEDVIELSGSEAEGAAALPVSPNLAEDAPPGPGKMHCECEGLDFPPLVFNLSLPRRTEQGTPPRLT